MAAPVDKFTPYTGLMHIAGLDPERKGNWMPPSWRPKSSVERLHAYRILYSMVKNAARFNSTRLTERQKSELREYGDPALFVDRVVAGILGEGVKFVVDGAQHPPPPRPPIPARPDPVDYGPDDADLAARVNEEMLRVWREDADRITAEWAAEHAAFPRLVEMQAALDKWIDDEQAQSKLFEMEKDGAVSLGDGLLVLGWDDRKARPTLTVMEPDAYEPKLDEVDASNFPRTVHLVWEEEHVSEQWLRRQTYRLVPLSDLGLPPRFYPWQDPAGQPSTVTCVWSDMSWPLRGKGLSWPRLDDTAGTFATTQIGGETVPIDRLDLFTDEIPVIHQPNTPASATHFGVSILTNPAQAFGDLLHLDTDIVKAAALAASPPIALAGMDVDPKKPITMGPGAVWPIAADGKLFTVDTSIALRSLAEFLEQHLGRLSVIAQVPEIVLGKVTGEATSGVALKLQFSPFDFMVGVLRMARASKYRLVAKMALRMMQSHGTLEDGPTPTISVHFQSAQPTDTDALISALVALLDANGISRRAALTLLEQAGFVGGDLDEILADIAAEDTEGAKNVADATGSEQAAADRLGVQIDQTVPAAPGGLA